MASVSISANGAMSSPYLYSTATVSEKSRSGSSVILNVSIVSHLQYSSSYLGSGYTIKGTVTAYGVSKTVTLKSSSSTWSGSSNHTIATTMTITVPATVNSITIGYKCSVSGLETGSKTGTSESLTLSKVLASVTSVTAFSDTTNPVMKFSNPAGFKIRPYLNFYTSSGGTKLLTLYPSGSSTTGNTLSSPYTWSLTETQRNTIRNKLGTRTSCYCAVGLEAYDGSTYINYSSKGVTFTNKLKPPLFTDFSFCDVNEKTLALTGDNSKIIKGYSTLKINISGEQLPTAQNGATMSHFLIEGKKYSYSEEFSCEISNWAKENIIVYAVDNRGISTSVTKTCNMINYDPLGKGNISVKRENNVGELSKLNYDGKFWNDTFGLIENSINATYKFKKPGTSDYTEGQTTIIPEILDNSFLFENYILGDGTENGFLVENSYEIIVNVSDKLSEIEYSAILGSGIPAIAVYKNNVAFHGKYDTELGGTQIYGDLFLNRIKMAEPNYIQFYKTVNEESYNASYNYFAPFNGDDEVTQSTTIGDNLKLVKKTIPFGDRTAGASTYGIEIGKGVNYVRVDTSVRYGNPNSSTVAITTLIYRRRSEANTIYGSCADTISLPRYTGKVIYDIPVEEGDFIFVAGYRSTASAKINVISDNASTSMRVNAIG